MYDHTPFYACKSLDQTSVGAVGIVVSILAFTQATGVQVPVTAQIQICNGVPRQFESCLKWRSQAYKP